MATFGPYPAVVLEVHDGDTMRLEIDLGFGVHFSYSCRVFGINAPELATAAGKTARDYAKQLVAPGSAVSVVSHGWDKFGGRFDGELTLPDGRSFGAEMLAAGMAVPFMV
jgi:endonuclease YncB( thermonuclease family)